MLQFDRMLKVVKAAEKAESPPPHLGLSPSLFSCISTNAHLVLKRAETAENVI